MVTARPLPRTAREVRLAAVPDGLPRPDDFVVADAPLPVPGPGDVLVRNRTSPSSRGCAPFSAAVGRRLRSRRSGPASHCSVRPSARWSPLRAVDGSGPGTRSFTPTAGASTPRSPKPNASPSTRASPIPSHISRPAAPRTARSPGSPPCATATPSSSPARPAASAHSRGRSLGCWVRAASSAPRAHRARPPGWSGSWATTPSSSRERCRLPRNWRRPRRTGSTSFVDLVGGEQLRAALDAAAPGARVALVGSLAGQLDPRHDGSTSPVEVDTFRMITLGVSMSGYRYPDHLDVQAEWTDRFAEWLSAGQIVFPHVRIAGSRSPTGCRSSP